MDANRNDLLGELAADASLERTDFLVRSTDQLRHFLDHNAHRIRDLGGLTLIDDDPDYLAVAPDLTFRSRSRYLDDATGEWISETEIIESAAELVELYNPADVYQAFADAARQLAGLPSEPTATGDLMDAAGIAPDETVIEGENPYAAAADTWAARRDEEGEPEDEEEAAARLYDLALTYQERSQESEAELINSFEAEARRLTGKIGDLIIVDDDDERLTLERRGSFKAEVIPEEAAGEWKTLVSAEQLVEFYDPTDVFGDLAEALAEAYPAVAAEDRGEDEPEESDDAEAGTEADDESVDSDAPADGSGDKRAG
jgi:hypothetical protein